MRDEEERVNQFLKFDSASRHGDECEENGESRFCVEMWLVRGEAVAALPVKHMKSGKGINSGYVITSFSQGLGLGSSPRLSQDLPHIHSGHGATDFLQTSSECWSHRD
jgi:hypothetical protein